MFDTSLEFESVLLNFLFVVALLFGLVSPASGGIRHPAVCNHIASMLRAGLGDVSGRQGQNDLLMRLAHKSHGRLALATWTQRRRSDLEAYLRHLGMRSASAQAISLEAPITMTALVRGEDLVAAVGVDGSASCMNVRLFHSHRGHLIEIVNPGIVQGMLCQRRADTISLGNLGGTLILAVEEPDLTNNRTTINLAAWNGRGWDANCGVVANYVRKLVPEDDFCGLANCSAALRAAKRVAAEARAFGNQTLPASRVPDGPAFQRLLALADHTGGMDMLPSAPGSHGGDDISVPRRVLTTVEGRPTLAVVGDWRGDPAMDSEPIGFLIGLWQAEGDKLSPIAGFHLRTATAVVRSVYVTH